MMHFSKIRWMEYDLMVYSDSFLFCRLSGYLGTGSSRTFQIYIDLKHWKVIFFKITYEDRLSLRIPFDLSKSLFLYTGNGSYTREVRIANEYREFYGDIPILITVYNDGITPMTLYREFLYISTNTKLYKINVNDFPVVDSFLVMSLVGPRTRDIRTLKDGKVFSFAGDGTALLHSATDLNRYKTLNHVTSFFKTNIHEIEDDRFVVGIQLFKRSFMVQKGYLSHLNMDTRL